MSARRSWWIWAHIAGLFAARCSPQVRFRMQNLLRQLPQTSVVPRRHDSSVRWEEFAKSGKFPDLSGIRVGRLCMSSPPRRWRFKERCNRSLSLSAADSQIAKALSGSLMNAAQLTSGGTDNHLMLLTFRVRKLPVKLRKRHWTRPA